EWETFGKWAEKYGVHLLNFEISRKLRVLLAGEIVYVKVFNLDMIIVNSQRMVYELFDKRSSIYSDRIDFPMLNDVMGWEWAFSLQRYGE
ncbi:hypothetical protein M422DRAFT_130147, partial [Sphaerobolus stellatus SS14]